MKSDVPKMLFSFFSDTSSGSRLDKKETKNQGFRKKATNFHGEATQRQRLKPGI
jgi:hypothetical protein